MKKLLTVSLVAMMAVSAARADIASTTYVDSKTGDIATLATSNKTSLTAAVNEVAGIAGAAATAENLSALQTTVSTLSGTVTTNKQAADQTQADLDVLEETVADIDAAYKAADTTLTNKFGELGNQTVKAYVDEKTANIATNDTVTALGNRVTAAEGEIETLTGAATVEGSVANAKKAGTDAAAALTAYKSEMTTALGTKQDTISDLATIRSGAAAGATAVQPAAITDMQEKSLMVKNTSEYNNATDKTAVYPSADYMMAAIEGAQSDLDADIKKAQKTADDNKTAIENLDSTYVTDSVFTAFQATNTDEIADAKKAGTDAATALETYKGQVTEALGGKQANLTEAQLAAVNSGITEAKVSTYDDYSDLITAAQNKANAAVVANEAITAGTGSVITYDAKGLVTSGRALEASDIPTIEQSQVNGLATSLTGATNAALQGIADATTGTTDGVWTLTMKVAGDTKTFGWELISR